MSSEISNNQLEQLRNTIQEALESTGTMAKIRAEIQSQIYTSLQPDEAQTTQIDTDAYKSFIEAEIGQHARKIFLTELISEFCATHGLFETQSTFTHEAILKPHPLRKRVDPYLQHLLPSIELDDTKPAKISKLEKMLIILEKEAFGCEITDIIPNVSSIDIDNRAEDEASALDQLTLPSKEQDVNQTEKSDEDCTEN